MNKEDIKNILSRFRHQKVEEVVAKEPVVAEEPKVVDGREVVLSLTNVSITFNKGKRALKAVDNVSFDIYKGEVFSLVGESGSGKTTIGKAVVRINPLSSGEIRFKGKRISGKLSKSADRDVIRNIQMIFQDPAASLNERATVDYIVSEGLLNFRLYSSEKDRVRKTEEALKSVGLLPEHLTRYPHEFSGGQRQRIGIARSIIMEPQFIVADEPISALDVSIRAQVLNLLKKFQEERGLTYLFIAHDLSVVRFISDRIAVIHKGKIVELAETEELFKHPLHPYTISLMSAIPIPDPLLEKEKQLIVYDPSQHDYSEEGPELVEIRKGHFILANSAEIVTYKEKIKALDKEAKVAAANEKKAAQAETVVSPVQEEASVTEEKPAKPKPTSRAKKVVKESSTIVVDETGKTVKPKVEKKPRTVQKKKE